MSVGGTKMAFALFYEHVDLSSIAANTNPSLLSGQDRQLAAKIWNGGLKNWQVAPFAQSPYDPPGLCPNCRMVVIDAQGVTLNDLRQLLYRIAGNLGATEDVKYIKALADDMGGSSGAVEPWPPV